MVSATRNSSTKTRTIRGAPCRAGPPFSIDDVIEFHYLLEDDHYIAEFLASSGGA